MSLLKRLIDKLPGGQQLAERVSYRRRSRKLAKIGNAEDRFTDIFERNKWKDNESRSGAGSSLASTANLRRALPALCADLEVNSLLDAPCGDFHWIRQIEWSSEIAYVGADIVRSLIESNQSLYGNENVRFIHSDLTRDTLPNVNLWLCRDCLIHLSYDDIQCAIENFQRSQIDYWLLTTHTKIERNIDIPTGHCRMINLELAPFGFPPPLQYVDDHDAENTGKCLGLWEHSQIAALQYRDDSAS